MYNSFSRFDVFWDVLRDKGTSPKEYGEYINKRNKKNKHKKNKKK